MTHKCLSAGWISIQQIKFLLRSWLLKTTKVFRHACTCLSIHIVHTCMKKAFLTLSNKKKERKLLRASKKKVIREFAYMFDWSINIYEFLMIQSRFFNIPRETHDAFHIGCTLLCFLAIRLRNGMSTCSARMATACYSLKSWVWQPKYYSTWKAYIFLWQSFLTHFPKVKLILIHISAPSASSTRNMFYFFPFISLTGDTERVTAPKKKIV